MEPKNYNIAVRREARTGGMQALVADISYGELQAEVAILIKPGQPVPNHDAEIRRAFLTVGQALQGFGMPSQKAPNKPAAKPGDKH